MHRYDKIKTVLAKGYTFEGDEQTNSSNIIDWSPNNVRRIFIGYNGVIISYYSSEGVFKKRSDLIRLDNEFQKEVIDSQQATQQGKEYKYVPILRILTGLRVMSCVEEIYFLADGVMEGFVEAELSYLTATLQKHRFSHLKYVGLSACTLDQLIALLRVIKPKNYNYLKDLPEFDSITKLVYDVPDTELKAYGLRPKIYQYDADVLTPLFDKIADVRDKKQNKQKLDEYERKMEQKQFEYLKELQSKYYKQLIHKYDSIVDIITKLDDICFHMSLVYRAQWGYRAEKAHVMKDLCSTLKTSKAVEALQGLDLALFLTPTNEDFDSKRLNGLQGLLRLIVGTQTAKTDTKITELTMVNINKLLTLVLLFVCYKTHELYAAFVTDNTLKYARDYHNDLKIPLGSIRHNSKIAEFCNKRLSYDYYTKACEAIGHSRKEDLTLSELYADCQDILTSMATYSYVARKRP